MIKYTRHEDKIKDTNSIKCKWPLASIMRGGGGFVLSLFKGNLVNLLILKVKHLNYNVLHFKINVLDVKNIPVSWALIIIHLPIDCLITRIKLSIRM